MHLHTVLMAAAATLAAGAAQAASVEIRDAVARVVVVPGDRKDIRVNVVSPNPRLPLSVRVVGDKVIVDGGLDRRIRGCAGAGEGASVEVRDVGRVAWRDMPQIIIHTPRDVHLAAGGAVFGSVGRSAALDLSNAGCGDWLAANVTGLLKISHAGSGDTRAGAAGEAKVNLAGSGDVAVAAVRGGLDVNIAGAGDVTVASVRGPFTANLAGSGDVKVAGGTVSGMTANIAGSGDVAFGGTAETLKARILGSGDVRARQVKGAVSRQVMGSGAVRIG